MYPKLTLDYRRVSRPDCVCLNCVNQYLSFCLLLDANVGPVCNSEYGPLWVYMPSLSKLQHTCMPKYIPTKDHWDV